VLHLARHHDVTVLTRENNRPVIEPVLSSLPRASALPRFVYHDLAEPILAWKKRLPLGVHWYYYLWHQSARSVVAELQRSHRFDLLHHLSFAAYRFPAAIWNHGVPCVWGPVAGIENTPWNLLPWSHPGPLVFETIRNTVNIVQSSRFSRLASRACRSTVVIAVSPEMQAAFVKLGHQAKLLPTIAVHPPPPTVARIPPPDDRPLRLLFVGRIVFWKGVELALLGLKESGTSAIFDLIGNGPFLPAARRLVRHLRLDHQVRFLGRLPYAEAVKAYADYDVFYYPSLHDSGANVALEAMSRGLPVICLDYAGPGFLVSSEGGIKVRIGPKEKIVSALADAVRTYDANRRLIQVHGTAAREAILKRHTWESRVEQMNSIYHEAVSRKTRV